MCQERLSQDPSQEELPAQSHRLHEDGLWGCGQDLPLTSPPADQTWKSPPAYTSRKKVYSANIDFPQLSFLLGTHTMREMPVRSSLFTSALLALPQLPMRCCRAREPFILPTPAFPLLGLSSTLQHRAKSWLIDSHVRSAPWRTAPAPDGFWALPPHTHCDESCQPLALSWWPAGGWQPSPSAQAAHPIRQTAGAPAVSPWADIGAGWDTEPAPHGRVQHHTLPDWTCLTAARAGHPNEMWKLNTKF